MTNNRTKLEQWAVELDKAEQELRRCRNAMDASTFHGRNRTDAALARVKTARQALKETPDAQ